MLAAAARLGLRERDFWAMLPREFARLARARKEEKEAEAERWEAEQESAWRRTILLANHWRSEENTLTYEDLFGGEDAGEMTAQDWAGLDLSAAAHD